MSMMGSLKIHDAIHKEIWNYFDKYPGSFINGKNSELYGIEYTFMTSTFVLLIIKSLLVL